MVGWVVGRVMVERGWRVRCTTGRRGEYSSREVVQVNAINDVMNGTKYECMKMVESRAGCITCERNAAYESTHNDDTRHSVRVVCVKNNHTSVCSKHVLRHVRLDNISDNTAYSSLT